MGVEDWQWDYPVELQDVSWDCAAASLTWALNAWGIVTTESEVVAGLGPARLSPAYGLLDASGAGIVDYLAELGIAAAFNPSCSWDDIEGAAGFQPMIMGGRAWYHWTGVRLGGYAAVGTRAGLVLLANPAPGWQGVDQAMWQEDFERLGPFSAVWFPA